MFLELVKLQRSISPKKSRRQSLKDQLAKEFNLEDADEMIKAEEEDSVEATNDEEDEERAGVTEMFSRASARSKISVTSMMAMKRDRVDKLRSMTIQEADQFASNSRKDSMVNSMRTFRMIQSRSGKIKRPALDPLTSDNSVGSG